MASSGYAMGYCKVKCSLCSVQKLWWSLHWGLRQGCWTGGLWRVQFCRFEDISRGGCSTRQPECSWPCLCVSGQPWACHGPVQSQMQPLQCTTGVVQPALGAAARLGRWFVGFAVMPVCGDFQRRRQHSETTAHRAPPVCDWPALGIPWVTAT